MDVPSSQSINDTKGYPLALIDSESNVQGVTDGNARTFPATAN